MSFAGVFEGMRRSWVGAARLVGRHNTLLSVLGAALAISFGALRGDPIIDSPLANEAGPPRAQLRVCADPDNLPYSNDRLEGFENALASLVARELDAEVRYTWSRRDGFIHDALDAGACDVLIGVPTSLDVVLTTRPYYRSTYVFVWRADRPWRVESFDDPILRELEVGVQLNEDGFASAPPRDPLAGRGIDSEEVGYSVFLDDIEGFAPSRIIDAVADGEIEVAVAWGPLAGFFAKGHPVELVLQPVAASARINAPSLPMAFDVSMGVRRGDEALRDRLDVVLAEREADIDALLESFAVPRLTAGQPRRAEQSQQ